jgi:alkanesulfonate monooxygenase
MEIAWFAALCDDDYEYLGVVDPALRSSWPHCRDIVVAAEQLGFDNVLLPSGYALGIDSVAFAAAIAAATTQIRLLLAVRAGEMWPPQLARQLATIDHIANGRLTINIISSDLPGAPLDSGPRYQRTLEVMEIVRALLDGTPVEHRGTFYDFELAPPSAATLAHGCPPFYFGGLSDDARECAAAGADVYLMWPDTEHAVTSIITDMRARAAAHDRSLRFGYRVHVVVRDTEAEARATADHLLERLDTDTGAAIRAQSLDAQSVGVRRQAELRATASDDGFVEPNLWTGIGRARSGCGAAIVGNPEQVAAKLRRYEALGIETFILSGYPHLREAEIFAKHVLPLLRN